MLRPHPLLYGSALFAITHLVVVRTCPHRYPPAGTPRVSPAFVSSLPLTDSPGSECPTHSRKEPPSRHRHGHRPLGARTWAESSSEARLQGDSNTQPACGPPLALRVSEGRPFAAGDAGGLTEGEPLVSGGVTSGDAAWDGTGSTARGLLATPGARLSQRVRMGGPRGTWSGAWVHGQGPTQPLSPEPLVHGLRSHSFVFSSLGIPWLHLHRREWRPP